MTYNPVTGEDWNPDTAGAAWFQSMNRSAPRWQLSGQPGDWVWRFFNFKPYTGRVSVEDDGFHWATTDYDTGEPIHAGITASLYEAYQSVEQNRPVSAAELAQS